METYNNLILPSNGPKLWPQVDLPPILPPYVRRAPGRPKKQRKKGNDEKVKQSQSGAGSSKSVHKRNQHSLKCGRCGELGHNARTCYGKQLGDKMLAPGENQVQTVMCFTLMCFTVMCLICNCHMYLTCVMHSSDQSNCSATSSTICTQEERAS